MEVCDDPAQVGASADLATWLKTAKNAAAKASLECHTGPPPPAPQRQRSALLRVAGVVCTSASIQLQEGS